MACGGSNRRELRGRSSRAIKDPKSREKIGLWNSLDFCLKNFFFFFFFPLILLEIWKNCHLKTQKKPSFPVWGGKNLWNSLDFCLKNFFFFAYFAWKLKKLSLKNVIKAFISGLGGQKPLKFFGLKKNYQIYRSFDEREEENFWF